MRRKARNKMGAEKQFENRIKNELRRRNEKQRHQRGIWFVKFFANTFTPAGIPDILVCINGRFLAIEVKGGTGYGLTELQKYNLQQIRASGGVGVCVYPTGWEKLLELLDRMENGEPVDINDENYILK